MLEEPLVITTQMPESSVNDDAVAAIKVMFVAQVTAYMTPDALQALLGTPRPSVADFDAWWSCEALVYDTSLADLVADLREVGALDSLAPSARQFLRYQGLVPSD